MRDTANRHRRDVQFTVGDKVLLKLQQYRQHSVAKPLSAKLSRRFYGPFVITEKIGPVAYRLQLPQGAKIHDVFHVGLLKPFVEGASAAAVADLPSDFVGIQPVVRPTRVLERRVALQRGQPLEQVLVEWSGGGQSTPTWEPLATMVRRFPTLLEDKDPFIEGGVDTNEEAIATEEEPTEVLQDQQGEEEEIEVVGKASGKDRQIVEEKKKPDRPKRKSKKPDLYGDFVFR